ncbi:hypothetical protein [Jiangella rhizosphaerae]|uniref:Sel1 repeat family protein n=1 Tax=Jiangella rhizosphaerae TaxID=2293569 RepID=A0A418KRY1_9ACTN|nr:hypothetical protein [Jiangella rhizosphaerae]RIQ26084.1 hypothetical protein DY240_10870 [Jiangella rhizosphaerae]
MTLVGDADRLAGEGREEAARALFERAIASGVPAAVSESKALRAAASSGHPDRAPEAGLELAGLLGARDDAEGARAALQQVIDSGHVEYAPRAAHDLGLELLYTVRDPQRAYEAWKYAAASGHRDYGPRSAARLGKLLYEYEGGDVELARRLWQSVVDSRHPVVAAEAAQNLRLTEPKTKGWLRRRS